MNVSTIVTDNVTELLVKILEFTAERHRILSDNIQSMHVPGYIPLDLPVEEFALLMDAAVDEHKRNKRLLLCDTRNIRFGVNGVVETSAIADEDAYDLLQRNPDEYLESELKKLSENSLNRKVAAELLKQKQGFVSVFRNNALSL